MDYVRWHNRPNFTTPVIIAAFAGWNDAGDAATTAASYLRESWHLRSFASIDPEEFFEFATTRPQVKLHDGVTREIVWPSTEFFGGTAPFGGGDAIVLLGTEPQLRWRTFCEQILAVAKATNARMIVTLGSLLSAVTHTAPVQVIGTASDSTVMEQHHLLRSRYEGPTGIVGVLTDAAHKAGVDAASLWATVPSYVSGATSPKAALALTQRVTMMFSQYVDTTQLEIASAAYERQVNELVERDPETQAFVRQLIEEADDDEPEDDQPHPAGQGSAPLTDANPDELVAEVEQFLRDQATDE